MLSMMMLSAPLTPALDLIAQQVELESEMTQQGIERFRSVNRKAVEGGREDGTTYGKSLLDGLIGKVADGISAFMAERSSGKAGRKGPAFKYLAEFNGAVDVDRIRSPQATRQRLQ
jgi:hypothetical protein